MIFALSFLFILWMLSSQMHMIQVGYYHYGMFFLDLI